MNRAVLRSLAVVSLCACSSPCAFGQTTFTNSSAIACAVGVGASGGNPGTSCTGYPSNISVSGLAGTVSSIEVRLNNLSVDREQDLTAVLVGPNGANLVFLSDAGNSLDGTTSGVTLTFADSAASIIAQTSLQAFTTGSFKPSGHNTGLAANKDNFPTPAPAQASLVYPAPSGSATLGGQFNGIVPNGTWSLYVMDDSLGPPSGFGGVTGINIAGGWSLIINTAVASSPTATTVASSLNPSFTGNSVTFTANVTSNSNPVTTGTVTFLEGALALSGAVALSASGQASFNTSTLTEGVHTIRAEYSGAAGFGSSSGSINQEVNNTTVVSGASFCNNGGLAVANDVNSPAATPYPSKVFVTGLSGTISSLTVDLRGLTGGRADDVEVLLVGPNGNKFVILNDVGGATNALSAVNLTLSDTAANLLPDESAFSSGTFRPTAVNSTAANFPAPAPASPYNFAAPFGAATFASNFGGASPNGTWQLFLVDDSAGGTATQMTNGWCVNFVTSADPATATTVTSSLNPSFTSAPDNSVTFTATVQRSDNNALVTSGSVTFLEGATVLAGPVALNASGQASFTTTSLSEGTHVITASYGGSPGQFNLSTGNITQTVNNHTVVSGLRFCNPGPLTIPTSGVGVQYPSRIFASGLSGVLSKVTVSLNNMNGVRGDDLDVLLVGPTGARMVVMSDAGGPTDAVATTLTLDDDAASQIPDNGPLVTGTFRPTSITPGGQGADAFPSPAPPGPHNEAAPSGTATLASTFQGTDPNGAWQLFVNDDAVGGPGAFTGGYCLNFTLASDLSISKTHTGNFTQGQTGAQYSIVVSNTSATAAAGTVTVNDTLPAGLTATAISGSGWNCTLGTLQCTRNDGLTGNNAFPPISLTVNVASNAAASLTNRAALTFAGDLNANNNTSDDVTSISAPTITKVTGLSQQTAQINTQFLEALTVLVKDGSGNPLPGFPVTFTAPTVGPSATVPASPVLTDASGQVTITPTANGIRGTYNLLATAGPVSVTFSLRNSGPPASLVTFGGNASPLPAEVNTAFPASFTVIVIDDASVTVPGVTVTFSGPAVGASATATPASGVSGQNGRVEVNLTANTIAGGPYDMTATAAGGLSTVRTLLNRPGQPASMTVLSGSGQSTVVNTPFANELRVEVKDQFGNPTPNVNLGFNPLSGPASASLSGGGSATTDANGQAGKTATANTFAGGPYNIRVVTSGASTNIALTNLPGPASQVTAVTGTPQTATIGTPFAVLLRARVLDAFNNPISGASVAFTPPASGASASLSPPNGVTDSFGEVTATATANNTVGTYNVLASIAAGASANFALTNRSIAPTQIAVAGGTPQTTLVSTSFGAPLSVTLRDQFNNLVEGATVTFAVPGSGPSAVLSSLTAVSNASGVASVTATANAISGGPYNVVASIPNGASVNFALTNNPSGPANFSTFNNVDDVTKGAWRAQYGGEGYFIPTLPPALPAYATMQNIGTQFLWTGTPSPGADFDRALERPTPPGRLASDLIDNAQLLVLLKMNDGLNHRVALYFHDWNSTTAEQTVTIHDGGNGTALNANGAILDGPRTLTGFRGGRWVVYTLRGNVVLKITRTAGSWAQLAGIFFGGVGSGAVTVNPGSAPQSTVVNTAFANQLRAIVKDGNGAPIPNISVSFTVPGSGASAILSTPSSLTDANGVAVVNATANTVSGAYDVVATAAGATTVFPLTNLPGAAATLTATGGAAQSQRIATQFSQALQATLKDQYGNPVPGISVGFAAGTGGAGQSATLGSASAVTGANGIASVTATANLKLGAYTVTATQGALNAAFSLTNTVGLPSAIQVFAGSPQSANIGSQFANSLVARVLDAGNNQVPGVTVNFAAPASGATATLSAPAAVTNASGNATVNAVASGSQGAYQVIASIPGVSPSAVFNLTNTQPSGGGGGATSAVLLRKDNNTAGNWKGIYGSEGHLIPNHSAPPPPSWVTITNNTGAAFTWDPNPSGPEAGRALEKAVGTGRIASALISQTEFQLRLNLTDGNVHQVAFYITDWNSSTAAESITILDAATNTVLDTQTESAYRAGRWLVYSLRGNVIVKVTRTAGSWAQLAGIFFGSSPE